MKRFIIILLVIISVPTKAQIKIIPVVDTSLFVGVDNPIKIESKTIPINQLELKTSNGIVTGKNGYYNIRSSKAEKNDRLSVIHKNKVVASKLININKISEPVVYLLGDSLFGEGNITKPQLLMLRLLVAKINYPLVHWNIHSFSIEIIHSGKNKGILRFVGNNLTKEVKQYLKMAEKGDEIIFDSIQGAVGAGC